jgi:hypothetical protein
MSPTKADFPSYRPPTMFTIGLFAKASDDERRGGGALGYPIAAAITPTPPP